MTDKILIAKIISSHGLKGQVKIMSFCQNPEDIKNYQPLFSDKNQELKITSFGKASGKNNNIFIVNIDGISDRNAADDLQNTELFIDEDYLEESDEDEFYYADLIGMDVINDKSQKIGKITDVMNYGAGDIFEIEFNEASKQNDKIQMFSLRDDIFPEINLEKGFVKFISPEIVEIK